MGVCAVATPVRDAVGAVGALTVEVPAVRFNGREDLIARRRAAPARPGAPRPARSGAASPGVDPSFVGPRSSPGNPLGRSGTRRSAMRTLDVPPPSPYYAS